jgi:PPOX class probable F420-dependent enzyme
VAACGGGPAAEPGRRALRVAHDVPTLRPAGVDAVWVGRDGDALVVLTPAGSGKVKRLRDDARVEVRPCGRFGAVQDGAVPVEGTAELREQDADVRNARAVIRRTYPVESRVVLGIERPSSACVAGRRRRGSPSASPPPTTRAAAPRPASLGAGRRRGADATSGPRGEPSCAERSARAAPAVISSTGRTSAWGRVDDHLRCATARTPGHRCAGMRRACARQSRCATDPGRRGQLLAPRPAQRSARHTTAGSTPARRACDSRLRASRGDRRLRHGPPVRHRGDQQHRLTDRAKPVDDHSGAHRPDAAQRPDRGPGAPGCVRDARPVSRKPRRPWRRGHLPAPLSAGRSARHTTVGSTPSRRACDSAMRAVRGTVVARRSGRAAPRDRQHRRTTAWNPVDDHLRSDRARDTHTP